MNVTLKRNALIKEWLKDIGAVGGKAPWFADFKDELERMQKVAATIHQTPNPSMDQISDTIVFDKLKGMDA